MKKTGVTFSKSKIADKETSAIDTRQSMLAN